MNNRGDAGWSIAVAGDDYQLNFLIHTACAFGLSGGDSGMTRSQQGSYGLNEGDSGTHVDESIFPVLNGRDNGTLHAWPDPIFRLDGERLRLLREQWRYVWEKRLRLKAESLFSPESARAYTFIDPPHFQRVEQSELRECFIQAWPDFIRWWQMPAGGQAALSSWEEKPDLIRYVERFEREAGRWIQPFRLQVDLVYTGINEPLIVSDNYFIMAPDRDYFWNEEWWLRLFRERY